MSQAWHLAGPRCVLSPAASLTSFEGAWHRGAARLGGWGEGRDPHERQPCCGHRVGDSCRAAAAFETLQRRGCKGAPGASCSDPVPSPGLPVDTRAGSRGQGGRGWWASQRAHATRGPGTEPGSSQQRFWEVGAIIIISAPKLGITVRRGPATCPQSHSQTWRARFHPGSLAGAPGSGSELSHPACPPLGQRHCEGTAPASLNHHGGTSHG